MRIVSGLLGVMMTADLALGQIQMPAPSFHDPKTGTAIQWLITAVFLVGSLVVAFKPAKRSKLE